MNNIGTVMVVMYDLWGRQRIAALLAEAGYVVVEASNGATGIRLADQYQPDAILLSGALPELHTDAVLEELRISPRTRRIPVLIVAMPPKTAGRFTRQPGVRPMSSTSCLRWDELPRTRGLLPGWSPRPEGLEVGQRARVAPSCRGHEDTG